jgi:hypothetical protein
VDLEGSWNPPARFLNYRRVLRSLAVLLGFILISLVLWWRVVFHLGTETSSGGVLDPGLIIWWLRWDLFALSHGSQVLYTRYLNAPTGASALWNTSMLALGGIFSPITSVFGAVATFNILCILGPALSAWTCSIWLRRHVGIVASIFGGLLFGFSPFVMLEDGGHVFLSSLFLLPVIAILIENICWRSPRPWIFAGPLLGIVVSVQFFISSEVLVITAIGAVIAVLAIVAANVRSVRSRLLPAGLAFSVAGAVAVAMLALPLMSQLASSHDIRGPVQVLDWYDSQPVDFIAAPSSVLLHSTSSAQIATQLTPENGFYLGIPLLILIVLACTFLVRTNKAVLVAAIVGVATFVLSLGGRLRDPGGAGHHGPLLPWGYLEDHLHFLQDVLPVRFAIDVWLAVALIAATALDSGLRRFKGWAIVAIVFVAVICLIPLLPSPKTVEDVSPTPSFFTSSDIHLVPRNSIALVAPIPNVYDDEAMLWQVQSGMWFAQVGGYVFYPVGSDHRVSHYGGPPVLDRLLSVDASGSVFHGAVSAGLRKQALLELGQTSTTCVIVGDSTNSPEIIATVEQILGRHPDATLGGVAFWRLDPPP